MTTSYDCQVDCPYVLSFSYPARLAARGMCSTSGSQMSYLSLSRELGCAQFSLSVFSSSLRLSLYPLRRIARKGARRCARPPGRTGTTRRIDAARAVLRRTRRTWARATTSGSGPTGTTSRSTPRLRTPRGRRRSRRRPPRRTCRTSRCLRGPPRGRACRRARTPPRRARPRRGPATRGARRETTCGRGEGRARARVGECVRDPRRDRRRVEPIASWCRVISDAATTRLVAASERLRRARIVPVPVARGRYS